MATVSPPLLTPASVTPFPIVARTDSRDARRWLGAGVALMAAALLWLTWTEYALPRYSQAVCWGINPLAPSHWAQHLHLTLPPLLTRARWNTQFRGGIALLWLGYGLVVYGGRRGIPSLRTVLMITAGFAFALAVLSPPLLATDAYAYAATGRLAVLYGQDPYAALPYSVLHRVGDPAQYFLAWDMPTVYGPVWTGLSATLVAALPHGWLWGEVLCLKLIAAGALCLLAWSAGQIAEHLAPGRGRVAALLVGLCPLLLLEGAGSGHNDLLMMACLFAAVGLFLKRSFGASGAWLGLAIGIKLLPVVIVPWLVLDLTRTLPDRRARRRAIAQLLGGMLLPLAAGYAYFWHGGNMWNALHQRTHTGHGTLLWAGLAYAALTAWLRAQGCARAPWLLAWAVFSGVFMATGLGTAFPWYICWFWPVLALRGGPLYRALFGGVFVFALAWEGLYATLIPAAMTAGH